MFLSSILFFLTEILAENTNDVICQPSTQNPSCYYGKISCMHSNIDCKNSRLKGNLSVFIFRLDILAKREENEPGPSTATVKEEPIKTEPILPDDEVEEFDDEELDADTDYMANYFDSGEGYLEEDDDMDEPCY